MGYVQKEDKYDIYIVDFVIQQVWRFCHVQIDFC